jgi:hypothetical protein
MHVTWRKAHDVTLLIPASSVPSSKSVPWPESAIHVCSDASCTCLGLVVPTGTVTRVIVAFASGDDSGNNNCSDSTPEFRRTGISFRLMSCIGTPLVEAQKNRRPSAKRVWRQHRLRPVLVSVFNYQLRLTFLHVGEIWYLSPQCAREQEANLCIHIVYTSVFAENAVKERSCGHNCHID